jgi:hypothetical protein
VAKDGKNKKVKAGKDAKNGKSAKAGVPKQIGGVKVPKRLRKLGDQAVKAVKDPAVSEVVAGALLAAAAALREGKDPKTIVGAAVKSGFKGAAGNGGSRLSDSLKHLAMDFAKRTLEGIGEKKTERDSATPEAAAPSPDPVPGAGEVRADPTPQAPSGPRKPKAPAAG